MIGSLIVFAAILCIYFLPTGAAISHRHRNTSGVAILNIFLGWTVLGWVVALAWAYHKDASGRYG